MATTYNNLGSVYKAKGELDKVIEYFQRCIKILERIGDKVHLKTVYMNVSILYEEIGDKDKAKKYKQKSNKIKIE